MTAALPPFRPPLKDRDLTKKELMSSVQLVVENVGIESPLGLFYLDQHKLFTLVSISFQHLLFTSTKNPGTYVIRVQDGVLAEKIAKRAKDPSTRRFFQSLLLPRKLKFGRSTLLLDFFNVGSWSQTVRDAVSGPERNSKSKQLKGALVIKNPKAPPILETDSDDLALPPQAFSGGVSGESLGIPLAVHLEALVKTSSFVLLIDSEKEYENAAQKLGMKKIIFPLISSTDQQKDGVYIASDFETH